MLNSLSFNPLSEQIRKRPRKWGLKLHSLMRDGMLETQQESMKAKTANRIAAVTIFDIAAYGMTDIG